MEISAWAQPRLVAMKPVRMISGLRFTVIVRDHVRTRKNQSQLRENSTGVPLPFKLSSQG